MSDANKNIVSHHYQVCRRARALAKLTKGRHLYRLSTNLRNEAVLRTGLTVAMLKHRIISIQAACDTAELVLSDIADLVEA